MLADNRDAFWLRHATEDEREIEIRPVKPGVSMIASGELDDRESARIRDYLPRFRAAAPPDAAAGDWESWEELLGAEERDEAAGPRGAMRFLTDTGFATVSSALIALPAPGPERRPLFRFLSRQPPGLGWEDVPV
jgi:hypothetical protein